MAYKALMGPPTRRSAFRLLLLSAIALVLPLPSEAKAEASTGSAIGATSSASIAISIRIAPRFAIRLVRLHSHRPIVSGAVTANADQVCIDGFSGSKGFSVVDADAANRRAEASRASAPTESASGSSCIVVNPPSVAQASDAHRPTTAERSRDTVTLLIAAE